MSYHQRNETEIPNPTWRKRNAHSSGAIHTWGSKDDDGACEGGNEVTEGPKQLCPIGGVPVSHGLAGVWGLGQCWFVC